MPMPHPLTDLNATLLQAYSVCMSCTFTQKKIKSLEIPYPSICLFFKEKFSIYFKVLHTMLVGRRFSTQLTI